MSYKSCPMVHHPEEDAHEHVFDWPPGHFHWTINPNNGLRYIWMILPSDDEGTPCCVSVREGAKNDGSWQWDGNLEKPTLTPSVWHHSTPDWHGFITAGQMVGC